jgi:hypothetical protein
MLQNKMFQNNDNMEIVTIVGDNGVFYSLSNGANIKRDIFFQKYSEVIPDPSNFFQTQSATNLQSLAEKLKTVDTSKIPDGDMPAQVRYKQDSVSEQVKAPLEYKELLQKQRIWEEEHRDLSDYKVYDDDEDAAADFERRIKTSNQQSRIRQVPPEYLQDEQNQSANEQVNQSSDGNQSSKSSYVSAEEEAFRFFKSFKKVYPITLSVDFEEKIAQPDFIKLMAVNYEGDIIKYYTKEFMNRIYNDPGFLEIKIYEKLKEIVFAEPSIIKEKKPRATRTTKSVDKKTEENLVAKRKYTKK